MVEDIPLSKSLTKKEKISTMWKFKQLYTLMWVIFKQKCIESIHFFSILPKQNPLIPSSSAISFLHYKKIGFGSQTSKEEKKSFLCLFQVCYIFVKLNFEVSFKDKPAIVQTTETYIIIIRSSKFQDSYLNFNKC